jgi:hypothetical protein
MRTSFLKYIALAATAAVIALTACNDDNGEQYPGQYGDEISIPDTAFRARCLKDFDVNGDGILLKGEAELVTELYLSHSNNINSLKGVEHFVNI